MLVAEMQTAGVEIAPAEQGAAMSALAVARL